MWWARFVDEEEWEEQEQDNLRRNVEVRELLLILGAGRDDGTLDDAAAKLRLNKGLSELLASFSRLAHRTPIPSALTRTFFLSLSLSLSLALLFVCVADYKTHLMKLDPAKCLRDVLHEKLAKVLGKAPWDDALSSVARTRNARNIPPLSPYVPLASPAPDHFCGSHSSYPPHPSYPTHSSYPPPPSRVIASSPVQSAPEAQGFRLSCTLDDHSLPVWGVTVSADGKRVFSSSLDANSGVWSTDTGRRLRSLTENSAAVTCAAFFPEGIWIVLGDLSNAVRVWSAATGEEQFYFSGHDDLVWAVAASPDSRWVASASWDSTVGLWSVSDQQNGGTLAGHNGAVHSVAFNPDGQKLVSGGSDSAIIIWNVPKKCLERTIANAHLGIVRGVAFTPDGQSVVSVGEDGTVKVWSWCSGELKRKFTTCSSCLLCLAVFPDGERIATGSSDSAVQGWDLHSGRCIQTLEGHRRSVMSVAVSRDGKTLVSGSEDSTARVWKLG